MVFVAHFLGKLKILQPLLLFSFPFLNDVLQEVILDCFIILSLPWFVVKLWTHEDGALVFWSEVHPCNRRSSRRSWWFHIVLRCCLWMKRLIGLVWDYFLFKLTAMSWYLNWWESVERFLIIINFLSFPLLSRQNATLQWCSIFLQFLLLFIWRIPTKFAQCFFT